MDHHWGSLEYYLDPTPGTWRAELKPHEVVAWRKIRKRRWIAWTGYSRYYSWNNIKKWTQRGDIYQLAMMNGQIVTVRRKSEHEVRGQAVNP